MSSKNSIAAPKLDTLKWIAIFAGIAASIYANYHFIQVAWALRAAAGLLIICLLIAIALSTQTGKSAWEFIKSARIELRKVVWPSRPETVQTTIVVIIMVAITALILWGVDSFFLWAVSWLTGQRG